MIVTKNNLEQIRCVTANIYETFEAFVKTIIFFRKPSTNWQPGTTALSVPKLVNCTLTSVAKLKTLV